jgi:hypothetical protein
MPKPLGTGLHPTTQTTGKVWCRNTKSAAPTSMSCAQPGRSVQITMVEGAAEDADDAKVAVGEIDDANPAATKPTRVGKTRLRRMRLVTRSPTRREEQSELDARGVTATDASMGLHGAGYE